MSFGNNKKVVITGGSGFIGTNLVEYLANHVWEVENFDIKPPVNRVYTDYWRRVDVMDKDGFIKALDEFSPGTLVHLAARTNIDESGSLDDYALNTIGVSNVIEAVNQTHSIERTILCSSQLVCRIGYKPTLDDDYCPDTLYGLSKSQGEQIVRRSDFNRSTWTIIRPTSIWGPWFDIPYKNFFETIQQKRYFHPSHMKTYKQWGYVGNTVYEIAKILEAGSENIDRQTFYIADFEPVLLEEFANGIREEFGNQKIRRLPGWFFKIAGLIGDMLSRIGLKNFPMTSFRFRNMITDELCDSSSLELIVGKLPFTLKEGISNTIDWMRKNERYGKSI